MIPPSNVQELTQVAHVESFRSSNIGSQQRRSWTVYCILLYSSKEWFHLSISVRPLPTSSFLHVPVRLRAEFSFSTCDFYTTRPSKAVNKRPSCRRMCPLLSPNELCRMHEMKVYSAFRDLEYMLSVKQGHSRLTPDVLRLLGLVAISYWTSLAHRSMTTVDGEAESSDLSRLMETRRNHKRNDRTVSVHITTYLTRVCVILWTLPVDQSLVLDVDTFAHGQPQVTASGIVTLTYSAPTVTRHRHSHP